ncbi:MAG: SDR family NAD(P)-dependent oxidoreductase [Verrucomicrobia bacterium]|nr:SDR family NAD(P)-dependent oxidoreductase [Verrucomicrobiota bacterium]
MPSLSEELNSYTSVVVTGGSSGIGKSLIKLAAKLSEGLVFCNLSRREPEIKNLGKRLNHFPCDLSRAEDVVRAAGAVEAFLRREVPGGRVLLINNSGFGSYGRFPEPNLAHQLEMLDVNVRALVQLTGLLLPLLRERGGAVMNIASTASFQPTAFMATYGASKAFVLNWSLALNEELRGTNVRTLAVCPGATESEFDLRAGLAKGSVAKSLSMTSEEVVTMAFGALASGQALVVTGWKNKVSAFVGSFPARALVARFAAKVLARFRLKQVQR